MAVAGFRFSPAMLTFPQDRIGAVLMMILGIVYQETSIALSDSEMYLA